MRNPPYPTSLRHSLDPSVPTVRVVFSKSQEIHGNVYLWMVPNSEISYLLYLGASIKTAHLIFCYIILLSFLKDFIYLFIFRETGREGERDREKHQCVVASCAPFAGDLACNPGMCPDWESNRNPLVRGPALIPLSYTSQAIFIEI